MQWGQSRIRSEYNGVKAQIGVKVELGQSTMGSKHSGVKAEPGQSTMRSKDRGVKVEWGQSTMVSNQ